MDRKKRIRTPISRNGIEPVKSVVDPKFHYRCFVRLENCDFSKYSSAARKSSSSALRATHKRISVSKGKSKTLGNSPIHHNESILESAVMEQEKNTKELHPNGKLTHTNQNIMHQKNVKFTDTAEKNDTDLVTGKFLRARKKVNYKERKSNGTPEVNKNITSRLESKKVPVYRRDAPISPKCRKRKGDLYDFMPESDEDKDSDVSFRIDIPAKRKKINHRPHILKQITNNRLNKTKINKKIKSPNYDEKIEGIMRKFTEKLKGKQEIHNSHNSNIISKKRNGRVDLNEDNNKVHSDSVFNSTMLPESQRIVLLDESIIAKSITDHFPETNIMGTGKIINTKKHVSVPSSENSSLDTGRVSPSDLSSFECAENTIIRSFDENNLENLFGFADDMEENNDGGKDSDNINILQNIIINRSSSSKQYMTTPKRFQEKKSWRFDTKVVNRNPHFLAVKKNSLPALNQDPVLDHTFDERIDMVNKMVLVPTNTKPTRQQSILNYIESTKEYSDYHDQSQSLYDVAEFSPIKHKEANKENSSEKIKSSNENPIPKRNILGLITSDNVKNQNPKNNEEVTKQKSDICDKKGKTSDELKNFGFDSMSEIIEDENCDEQSAKPFRMELTFKKYNKKKPEISDKPVRDSEVRKLIEEDPGFEEVVDKDGLDCGELGLFEDFETSPKEFRGYKITKKKITHPNTDKIKAPKEKLTKEAQKWIKQFNEMCNEVEHEVLEIE